MAVTDEDLMGAADMRVQKFLVRSERRLLIELARTKETGVACLPPGPRQHWRRRG
jgi:hypothetical protein